MSDKYKLHKLLAALLMFVFLATSCTTAFSPPTAPDLTRSFSFTGAITYGKLTATANFSRDSEGGWTVSITEPKEISGFVMTYKNGTTTAQFAGYAFDFDEKTLPFKSTCAYIVDCLDKIAQLDNLTVKEGDGFLKISGSIPEGGFIVTAHKDTGVIVSIECAGVKVEVSNMIYGGAPSQTGTAETTPPTSADTTITTTGATTTA